MIVYGFYQWKRYKAAKNANFLYYTNIKPALERLGFIGSPGDVNETPDEVNSLYYLRGLEFINAQDVLQFQLAEFSDQYWAEFEVCQDTEQKSRYQITFATLIDSSKSKSVLSLRITNPEKEKELPKLSATIVDIYAPTHFFNQANLDLCLSRLIQDIEWFEKNGDLERYWLVYGVEGRELERVCNLPKLTNSSPSKLWKKAGKNIRKGYSHAAV